MVLSSFSERLHLFMSRTAVLTRKVTMISNFPQFLFTVNSLSSTNPTGCCGVEHGLFFFRYYHWFRLGVFFPNLHHMTVLGLDKVIGNIFLIRSRGVLNRTALRGVYTRHKAVTVPRISMNLSLCVILTFFHIYPCQPALEIRVNCKGFEHRVVMVLEFYKTTSLRHFYVRQYFSLAVFLQLPHSDDEMNSTGKSGWRYSRSPFSPTPTFF